jgi:hypothetical protein
MKKIEKEKENQTFALNPNQKNTLKAPNPKLK